MSTDITISGVRLKFPNKPYPSQISMMNMIIKGLQKAENCLLESPTGSGKTLSLLCSTIAWRKWEIARRNEELAKKNAAFMSKVAAKYCSCDCPKSLPVDTGNDDVCCGIKSENKDSDDVCCKKTIETKTNIKEKHNDREEDKKKVHLERLKDTAEGGRGRKTIGIKYEEATDESVVESEDEDDESNSEVSPADSSECLCLCHRVAKTDTITVKDSSSTTVDTNTDDVFDPTLLANSRRRRTRGTPSNGPFDPTIPFKIQTCIHKDVSKAPNKDELCKQLRKESGKKENAEKRGHATKLEGCMYFNRIKNKGGMMVAYDNLGFTDAWDIEDLVKNMKEKRLCPYYMARGLIETVDIVFCPYNYLIDPRIRESMSLEIENQIIIIDEAHNIEDICRDAMSFPFTREQFSEARKRLDPIPNQFNTSPEVTESVKYFITLFDRLVDWIDSNIDSMTVNNYDGTAMSQIWTGIEIMTIFKSDLYKMYIGPEQYPTFKSHVGAMLDEEGDDTGSNLDDQIKLLLGSLRYVLECFYTNDQQFVDDFRIGIVKTKSDTGDGNDPTQQQSQFRRYRGPNQNTPAWVYTVHFWCLNPAVCFHYLKPSHSVILCSGTLSPMDTFQSELDAKFEHILEAKHVISDRQVWVGAISCGPNKVPLLSNYKTNETFAFQDETGLVVLDVCRTVPFGILCFLPSYALLNKLLKRWTETKLLMRISEYKEIVSETRVSKDFDQMLADFYDCINSKTESQKQNGAIMFAVYRGRASEGLDFSDNYCRVVISIGIPYPNFKDTQVDLKMKFNDKYTRERNLLPGSKWYEIQAFRAVNQALGRCIRHRYDWGAILLIDERYVKKSAIYSKGLSKWIASKIQTFTDYNNALTSLQQFNIGIKAFTKEIAEMKVEPKREVEEIEEAPPLNPIKPTLSPSMVEQWQASKVKMDIKNKQQMEVKQEVKQEPSTQMFSIFTPINNTKYIPQRSEVKMKTEEVSLFDTSPLGASQNQSKTFTFSRTSHQTQLKETEMTRASQVVSSSPNRGDPLKSLILNATLNENMSGAVEVNKKRTRIQHNFEQFSFDPICKSNVTRRVRQVCLGGDEQKEGNNEVEAVTMSNRQQEKFLNDKDENDFVITQQRRSEWYKKPRNGNSTSNEPEVILIGKRNFKTKIKSLVNLVDNRDKMTTVNYFNTIEVF